MHTNSRAKKMQMKKNYPSDDPSCRPLGKNVAAMMLVFNGSDSIFLTVESTLESGLTSSMPSR
jgi:hypothetical protein